MCSAPPSLFHYLPDLACIKEEQNTRLDRKKLSSTTTDGRYGHELRTSQQNYTNENLKWKQTCSMAVLQKGTEKLFVGSTTNFIIWSHWSNTLGTFVLLLSVYVATIPALHNSHELISDVDDGWTNTRKIFWISTLVTAHWSVVTDSFFHFIVFYSGFTINLKFSFQFWFFFFFFILALSSNVL